MYLKPYIKIIFLSFSIKLNVLSVGLCKHRLKMSIKGKTNLDNLITEKYIYMMYQKLQFLPIEIVTIK